MKSVGFIASIVTLCLVMIGLASYGISRDVPVGTVTGKVTMQENNRPLVKAIVSLAALDPEQQIQRDLTAEVAEDGSYTIHAVPAGIYRIDSYASVHQLKGQHFVRVEEGQQAVSDLVMDPDGPNVRITSEAQVFLPSEFPQLSLFGFLQEKEITATVWRIPYEKFAENPSAFILLNNIRDGGSARIKDMGGMPIRTDKIALKSLDIEGQFQERLKLDSLAEGTYIVQVIYGPTDKPAAAYHAFYVSKIAALVKPDGKQARVMVTDLEHGTSIEGAKVEFLADKKVLGTQLTNTEGLAAVPSGGVDTMQVVVATYHGSLAVVRYSDYQHEDGVRFSTQTDRPIYRPGDHVSFRSIIRKEVGETLQVVPNASVIAKLENDDGDTIHSLSLKTDDFGTVSGEFDLPAGVSAGATISLEALSASSSTYLSVAAYRKPEVKITMSADKKVYYRGDIAHVTIKCEHFFGGPVPGAKITTMLSDGPMWGYYESAFDEESEGGSADNWLHDQTVVADDNGVATVDIDTSTLDWTQFHGNDLVVGLNASVTEGDDRYYESDFEFKVYQGEARLTADFDHWMAKPNQMVNCNFSLKNIEDGSPISGANLQIEAYLQLWNHDETVEHQVYKGTVITSSNGTTTAPLKFDREGDYILRVKYQDSKGRWLEANSYLWVYGESYSLNDVSSVKIATDQKSYVPGQTATIAVASSHHGCTAWVTLEGGSILWQKSITLAPGTTEMQVQIPEVSAPNVSVNVVFVDKKEFFESHQNVKISTVDKSLNVAITGPKANLRPGQSGQYSLKVTDGHGNPQETSLAVGVVDESIYALASDEYDPLADLYPERYESAATLTSFPNLYLDGGDKGPKDVQIRKDFRDTAKWMPSIKTGPDGTATFTVEFPDNLTAWRLTAAGCTKDTKVGKGTCETVVTKELICRLAIPPILTQFDKTELVAMVNNTTSQSMTANIRLNAGELTVEEGLSQSVTVSPNGQSKFVWHVTAGKVGSQTLVAEAQSGNFHDGIQQTITVKPFGVPYTYGGSTYAGSGVNTATAALPTWTGQTGTLHVTVSSTLSASLLETLKSMIDYPYGCTEQTTSRFVSTVAASRMISELNLPHDPSLEQQVKEIVSQSIHRLSDFQHSDGGWGWWQYDQSDPWMTAVVLEGLQRAKESGIAIPESMVESALRYAKGALKDAIPSSIRSDDSTFWGHSIQYLAYGVLLYGPDERASEVLAWESRKTPDAILALRLQLLGRSHSADFPAAYDKLKASSQVAEDRLEWPSTYWGSDIAPRVLDALMRFDPNHPDGWRVASGLMKQRKGSMWQSTYDTSLAVTSLTSYLRNSNELGTIGHVEIYADGKVIGNGELTKPSDVVDVTVPLSQIQGAKEIRVVKSGEGSAYLNWHISSLDTTRPVSATSYLKGLVVTRTFNHLGVERQPDGTRYLVAGNADKTFKTGEVVKCQVEVRTDTPLEFVMIEIPLPSNMRPADADQPDNWTYWFTGMQTFEDRVAVFQRSMAAGKHQFEINLRAEQPGHAEMMPARITLMYDSNRWSITDSTAIEVTP